MTCDIKKHNIPCIMICWDVNLVYITNMEYSPISSKWHIHKYFLKHYKTLSYHYQYCWEKLEEWMVYKVMKVWQQ